MNLNKLRGTVSLNLNRLGRVVIVLLVGAAVFRSSAGGAGAATITVGPPLPAAVNAGRAACAGAGCTMVNTDLEGMKLASPVDGLVVAWRINEAQPGFAYALRVLTPGVLDTESATFTATATSASEEPAGEGLEIFPTDLPILAGQMIGIDQPGPGDAWIGIVGPGEGVQFRPRLADGETRSTSPVGLALEVNAEVLPRPIITALRPATAIPSGGGTAEIEGSDFERVESVTFGSRAATYTVDSESRITASVPPGSGEVPVTVTTEAGSATAPEPFRYEDKSISEPTGPTSPAQTPPPSVSHPRPSLSIGAPTLDRSDGTAMLPVTVSVPGTLSVRATGTKSPTHLEEAGMPVYAAGTVEVPVAVTQAGHRPLARKGKIRIVPLVTFTPSGGPPMASYRPVVLRLTR